jgi:hypothetical protein
MAVRRRGHDQPAPAGPARMRAEPGVPGSKDTYVPALPAVVTGAMPAATAAALTGTLGLALAGLGILIVITPSLVPGL